MDLKVNRHAQAITQNNLDRFTNAIVVLAAATNNFKTTNLPYAAELRQRLTRTGKTKWPTSAWRVDLPNLIGTSITLAAVKEKSTTFELLSSARKLVAPHRDQAPAQLAIALIGFAPDAAKCVADAMLAAILAAWHTLPTWKSKPEKSPARLPSVIFYGLEATPDLKLLQAQANGNNLARDLTVSPPNHLTPLRYRQRLKTLARQHGWKFSFMDQKTLQRKGAGAFLAVSQGSQNDEAGIVHLRYDPAKTTGAKALALVGKGVCFDTGGNNLKPAKSMHGMHEDMAGSAVALGTLLALSELKVGFAVDCWLALSENLIGPRAYKQNDVVVAANGTSIEIIHTDAEGRMLLADTLHFASEATPQLIIDYATLTGTCVYALSTRYSGAFTTAPELIDSIIAAGVSSGERVWPFPMDEDFDSELDSSVADVKQCTIAGEADHILAARFLQRFVGTTPWLHIDLAAASNKGGLAHIATDTTGFGVRYTLDLLLQQNVLERVKK